MEKGFLFKDFQISQIVELSSSRAEWSAPLGMQSAIVCVIVLKLTSREPIHIERQVQHMSHIIKDGMHRLVRYNGQI